MVFLEDRSGLLHWKIFRRISVRPLGAKTAGGREAAGDAVTLICPFWVKHKKGQEEKVFLVPFLYMRPPSSHTSWARCRRCVGCHGVRSQMSCQGHVRLVVWTTPRHCWRGWKPFG